ASLRFRTRMVPRRQLDTAGFTGARSAILTLAFMFLLPCVALAQAEPIETIRQLFAEKRWEQVVKAVPGLTARNSDSDYYYGIALAQLGRIDEARFVLMEGRRQWPDDHRFPIELGGVAFKQKRYALAAKWVRRGTRLRPDDPYAEDLLATIYFLQGNLEAALQHWNRISKPRIE